MKEIIGTIENDNKFRAAYALNMCAVSVSQIIDYNDTYILEQEYDAVLNNLNLEKMLKDEALLNIITELLNTVTFFKIQELEKEKIERKYQKKIKDAVWSAIPNLSIIVTGGPVMGLAALAYQVGTGYMNYRREKANIESEKEEQDLSLRITAMEQFHALKRELFTTSWKLADKYEFPDKYRLTEYQIKQYNEILMDNDLLRKFERLQSIEDFFVAYPAYWYFRGQAANNISKDVHIAIDDSQYYIDEAKQAYNIYIELTKKYSVLRQDVITAACALEYVELLEPEKEAEKISGLLELAFENSRNTNDIKQLCAFSYLKLGTKDSMEKAVQIFRDLVNENYNRVLNLQFASILYAKLFVNYGDEGFARQYHILKKRYENDKEYFFALPESTDSQFDLLNDDFVDRQIKILKKKYTLVLQDFFTKFRVKYNQVLPTCRELSEYKDEYFYDTERSRIIREKDTSLYLMTSERDEYICRLIDSDIRMEYLKIFNEMFLAIKSLDGIDESTSDELQGVLAKSINANGKRIKPIMEQLRNDSSKFNVEDYKKLHDIKFWDFVQPFSKALNGKLSIFLNSIKSIDDISKAEQVLAAFCEKYAIKDPEYLYEHKSDYLEIVHLEQQIFDYNLWEDENIEEMSNNKKYIGKMRTIVDKYSNRISKNPKKVKVLHGEFMAYKEYFYQPYLGKKIDSNIKQTTICIVNDMSISDMDLIFTKEGVIPIVRGKMQSINLYQNISFAGADLILSDKKYKVDDVDIDILYEMIQELAKVKVN